MKANPFNTLTGRMVLVTVVAVIISYAIAFAIYANERGAALRRAAEMGIADRVAYAVERLREMPPARRVTAAESIRDLNLRFHITANPEITQGAVAGAGARIARGIEERVVDSQAHAQARIIEAPSRRWREARDRLRFDEDNVLPRSDPTQPRLVKVTEVTLSVRIDDGAWLNVRARLPGPRPAPLSVLVGALASVVIVGIGAALISRQIGRPLADLANAAKALGAGQTNVSAPVSGPEDVRRASSAFNAMADRLGRQLNRQRQMLWALSHDLRTPITAIRLRAELIEDDAARQRLLASVEEMEQLTEQALALARAGASEEARTRVDLAEIARTLCGELQDMGVNITAEADAPVIAECRPSEIARALRNLAENAAKYGGGGIMRAYGGGANEAIVEVLDNGPGVPPEQLVKLSEPFFRADAARSSNTNGAGLGLSIAQAIAEAHAGRLVLSNRTPKGFSAKLILPG